MRRSCDCNPTLPQVDGKSNPKIQSIHLERFPVHKAQFSPDGETVIATSLRNKMFYLYDMMEGRVSPVHTVRGQSRCEPCRDPVVFENFTVKAQHVVLRSERSQSEGVLCMS